MRRNTGRRAWMAVFAIALSAGCVPELGPRCGEDADCPVGRCELGWCVPASADAGGPDAVAGDGGRPDAAAGDALPPDALPLDALTPDASPPDALAPDALTPDALAPDALAPDALPPDLGPPPGCGDGVVDGDEECDELADDCAGCAVLAVPLALDGTPHDGAFAAGSFDRFVVEVPAPTRVALTTGDVAPGLAVALDADPLAVQALAPGEEAVFDLPAGATTLRVVARDAAAYQLTAVRVPTCGDHVRDAESEACDGTPGCGEGCRRPAVDVADGGATTIEAPGFPAEFRFVVPEGRPWTADLFVGREGPCPPDVAVELAREADAPVALGAGCPFEATLLLQPGRYRLVARTGADEDVEIHARVTLRTICGNRELEGDEACDDGNADPFDGCHACDHAPFTVGEDGVASGSATPGRPLLVRFEVPRGPITTTVLVDAPDGCGGDVGVTMPGDVEAISGCPATAARVLDAGFHLVRVRPLAGGARTFRVAVTQAAVCGNGVPEVGEPCDDGNVNPDDGCDRCSANACTPWLPGVDDRCVPRPLPGACPEGAFALPDGTCSAPRVCPAGWVRDGLGCAPPTGPANCPRPELVPPGAAACDVLSWPCDTARGWTPIGDGPGCAPDVSALRCAAGEREVFFEGSWKCERTTGACPPDPWRDQRYARYVHVALTGDDRGNGTAASPLRNVSAALTYARMHGANILVGPGRFDLPANAAVPQGSELRGVCEATTVLVGRLAFAGPGESSVRHLSLEDEDMNNAAGGLLTVTGGELHLEAVTIRAAGAPYGILARGGAVDGSQVHVDGARVVSVLAIADDAAPVSFAELRGFLLTGGTGNGLVASGTGAVVEAYGGTVRQIAPVAGLAPAAEAEDGGVVIARDLIARDCAGLCLVARDNDSELRLERVLVDGMTSSMLEYPNDSAVLARNGATLDAVDLAVTRSQAFGVVAFSEPPPGEGEVAVTGERWTFDGVAFVPRDHDLIGIPGTERRVGAVVVVDAGEWAVDVRLDQIAVRESAAPAFQALNRERLVDRLTAELSRFVVDGVRVDRVAPPDATFSAPDPGTLSLTDAAFVGWRGAGIDAAADLIASRVRLHRDGDAFVEPFDAGVVLRGHAFVSDLRVDGAADAGVYTEGSEIVTLDRLDVRGTRATERLDLGGAALRAAVTRRGTGELELRGLYAADNATPGLRLAGAEGATIELTNVDVVGGGPGLVLSGAAEITLDGGRFVGVAGAGVRADGQGPRLEARHLVVDGVGLDPASRLGGHAIDWRGIDPSVPGAGFFTVDGGHLAATAGAGVVHVEASAELRNVTLADTAGAGVVEAGRGPTALIDVRIERPGGTGYVAASLAGAGAFMFLERLAVLDPPAQSAGVEVDLPHSVQLGGAGELPANVFRRGTRDDDAPLSVDVDPAAVVPPAFPAP